MHCIVRLYSGYWERTKKKQQFIDENDCLHQLFQINEENAEKWLEDMRFYKSHFAILTIAYSFS